MTTDRLDQTTRHWHIGPKHILFGVLGLLTLFVIYNNERFIIDHSDPLWNYYLPVRWLLAPHGLTGAIALCLGASQFSTRLRATPCRRSSRFRPLLRDWRGHIRAARYLRHNPAQ